VGAIVVFDLTSSHSFENVSRWIEEAEENTRLNTTILLIGNKVDLPNRDISEAKVNAFLEK
jgi:GTPase SAR1 family protein